LRIYDCKITYELAGEIEAESLAAGGKISPKLCFEYFKDAFNQHPTQEQLWVACLNKQLIPIYRKMVSLGIVDSCMCHPREVFGLATFPGVNASAIIIAHNHPDGSTMPSNADIKATETLKEASKYMGIPVLEHTIVGDPKLCPKGLGYYSFANAGSLKDDTDREDLIIRF
jgi:DNA repair protein RadC